MWNSAWLEDVKWSFATDDAKYREWTFDGQKTNYADWRSSTTSDADAEELYDAAASAVSDNYPPGYLLFSHFVDELEDDSRMEFYVNHLSAECAEAGSETSERKHKARSEHEHGDDNDEDDERDKYYYRPRLDTVPEETEEDLARDRGEEFASISSGSDDSSETTSSSSEQWKWGNGWLSASDDDSGTVIDVPLGELNASVDAPLSTTVKSSYGFHEPAPFDVDFELSDDDDDEADAMESPVKRRRTGDGDDDDDDDECESSDLSRAPSLADSLAQFELLEKEINEAAGGSSSSDDVVFRTSATSAPFGDVNGPSGEHRDCDALSVSSQVFFDCREDLSPIQLLETSSDECSDVFVDPFEEPHKAHDDVDEDEWNNDDYLHSDMEDYDTSDTEEGDGDEALDSVRTLSFFTRSHRMRSFRSYGDGLNAISDAALNSNSSSDRSSISPQNSLEEPAAGPRSSAEALSEDSGYGDGGGAPSAAKKNNELELQRPDEDDGDESTGSKVTSTAAMCAPDGAAQWLPLSAMLVRHQSRTRSPLSVDEAEEFKRQEIVNSPLARRSAGVEEICMDLGRTSALLAAATAERGESDDGDDAGRAAVGDDGRPDLDASNFKQEGTQDRSRTGGSCYTAAAAAAASARECGQQHQSLADVDHEQFASAQLSMDSAFYPQPVVLKRYGPHHEVEVYISSQKSPVDERDGDDAADGQRRVHSASSRLLSVPAPGVRGVHFSPVVSAVNWRESYLDPSSDSDADDARQEEEEEARKKLLPGETRAESSGDSSDGTRDPATPVSVSPAPSRENSEPPVSPAPSVAEAEHTAVQVDKVVAVVDEKTPEPSRVEPAPTDGAERKQASKKPALFQRFSLSRLSARMSATFGRSSATTKTPADNKLDAQSPAVGVVDSSGGSITASLSKKSATAKPHKKKMAPVEAPVELSTKKMDEFKKKEPKKRGFFKQFYRSASSPPAVKSAKCDVQIPKGEPPLSIVDGGGERAPPGPPVDGAATRADNETVVSTPSAVAASSSPKRLAVKPPIPPARSSTSAKKSYLDVPGRAEAPQPAPPPPPAVVSSAGLQVALEHFKESARMERERLANSVPDLASAADAGAERIDRGEGAAEARAREPSKLPPRPPPPSSSTSTLSRERARQAAISRANVVHDAWNATASRAALNLSRRNIATGGDDGAGRRGPTAARSVGGVLETDLDVPTSDETNLDELIQSLQKFCTLPGASVPSAGGVGGAGNDKRFKSMLNLGCSSSAPASVEPNINNETMIADPSARLAPDPSRAKSMEFLLDEDNKSAVQVPENQLKRCGERQMSEHELRIQRSLQKLNVPEWYRNNARPSLSCAPSPTCAVDGPAPSILRRRGEYGSSSLRSGGWTGLRNPMATSMTSLGSELSRSATPTRVAIPTRVRPDWKTVKSSRESLAIATAGAEPPGSLPNQSGQPFARWTSGRSSYGACPSPAPSTASSTASYRSTLLHQHGRTPYLGWRSQERLNAAPAPLSVYQSPAERLASSLVSAKRAPPAAAPDQSAAPAGKDDDGVRSSIRQVTSAIVHYVTGDGSSSASSTPRPSRNGASPERHPLEALSRSPSPRRQRCVWVESSFVGEAGDAAPAPASPVYRRSAESSPPRIANNARPAGLELADEDAKREATLDDVLTSLLGLPTAASRSPARSPLGAPPRRISRTAREPIGEVTSTSS